MNLTCTISVSRCSLSKIPCNHKAKWIAQKGQRISFKKLDLYKYKHAIHSFLQCSFIKQNRSVILVLTFSIITANLLASEQTAWWSMDHWWSTNSSYLLDTHFTTAEKLTVMSKVKWSYICRIRSNQVSCQKENS